MPILFILLGGALGAGGVLGFQALTAPGRRFLAFFVSEAAAPPSQGRVFDTFEEAEAFAMKLLEDPRVPTGEPAWVLEMEGDILTPQKATKFVKPEARRSMGSLRHWN